MNVSLECNPFSAGFNTAASTRIRALVQSLCSQVGQGT